MKWQLILIASFFSAWASAQFAPTVASESHCILQIAKLERAGLGAELLEHGAHGGDTKRLVMVTQHNLESLWGGKLVSVQEHENYVSMVWGGVKTFDVIGMLVNTAFPYNYCTFTPKVAGLDIHLTGENDAR